WLWDEHGPDVDRTAFRRACRTLLGGCWLVPVDPSLGDQLALLAARIETVRVSRDQRGSLRWSRDPEGLPDLWRAGEPGLDPVHPPENARAGLTRSLALGWTVGRRGDDGAEPADEGRLVRVQKPEASDTDPITWGLATATIPYRLHDEPRRLML